jgi:hypothetical protein
MGLPAECGLGRRTHALTPVLTPAADLPVASIRNEKVGGY